jgi:hypothetical protein
MAQYRYAEFLAELRAGLFHGVFVDDTGSPGLGSADKRLHPERKTWVAVICSPDNVAEVLDQMPGSLEELRKVTGATEFHFTDIYAGKGQFRGTNPSLRIALFEFMAHMFLLYNFPILVQTLDPVTVEEVRGRGNFPKRLGPFNLMKQEDLALFCLLVRVKTFLKENATAAGPWARVFVDEGYKKNGAMLVMPSLRECFVDGFVCFAKSNAVFPIQLADFAAFCLNRTQLILAKENITEFDRTLLEILSPIAWNYRNIAKVTMNEIELARRMD